MLVGSVDVPNGFHSVTQWRSFSFPSSECSEPNENQTAAATATNNNNANNNSSSSISRNNSNSSSKSSKFRARSRARAGATARARATTTTTTLRQPVNARVARVVVFAWTQTECRHAFYVACVGQSPVSASFVREVCLRSFCVGFPREPLPREKNAFLCGKTPDANFREAHAGSAHMHFTWPAWDKTQSRLALFANLFGVACLTQI